MYQRHSNDIEISKNTLQIPHKTTPDIQVYDHTSAIQILFKNQTNAQIEISYFFNRMYQRRSNGIEIQ